MSVSGLQLVATLASVEVLNAPATWRLVQSWCRQASAELVELGFRPVDVDGAGTECADREQSHLRAAWQDLRDPVSGQELRVYAQLCASSRLEELGTVEAFLDLHMVKDDGETDVLVAQLLLRAARPLSADGDNLQQRLAANLAAATLEAFPPTAATNVFSEFCTAVDEALSP